MSNPRSLADFTISRIAARSESPGFTVVLLMLLAREFTPSTFPVITGPSWLTHVSRSASYTVPGIDPCGVEALLVRVGPSNAGTLVAADEADGLPPASGAVLASPSRCAGSGWRAPTDWVDARCVRRRRT